MARNNGLKKTPPGRVRRAINAGIAGTLMGATGGAIIGASFDATITGLLIGALLLGLGEAVTDWTRKPGKLKPFLYRVLVSAGGGAVLGALLSLFFPDLTLLVVGGLIGFLSGLSGLHWKRIFLGIISGLAVAIIAGELYAQIETAVLSALVVLFYRLLAALLLPDQEIMTVAAERVPQEEIPYVVPFQAHSAFIGPDYFMELARTSGSNFKRNETGVGIVENMDNLRGPTFDPSKLDPLIREFYEHTSRFKLSIIPHWKWWMKPVFRLYKQWVALPIGQANLPFNQEEAQRGIVSYIDTIDFRNDDIIDLRGWVRAFEETGEAIYVGVYTTFRHDNRGFVSVGFPLPESNFTATLLPYNKDAGNLLLTSRDTSLPYPGHYLSFNEEGKLTVLALPAFQEEIEVLVNEGQIETHHRFYLGKQNFLTLFYSIERLENAKNPDI